MAKLSVAGSQNALFDILWVALVEQQRSVHGNDAGGAATLNVEETLATVARIAAKVVMAGRDEQTRMRYAARFDTVFMDEHRRLERARAIS